MSEDRPIIMPIEDSVREARALGPIPFIWGGIKEGSFGYVFGPSKCGKTTFCENLAMSLVTGAEKFLGNELLKKEYKILYIHFEETALQRCDRNFKQLEYIEAKTKKNPKNLSVISDEFPRYLSDNEEWSKFTGSIMESGANVIFIDSQTRASNGDIERSDVARTITRKLREIGYESGATMIVIHHTPKLYGRQLTMDTLAGSHVFAQEADFLIGVNKLNNIRYVKEVASRYKREDDENVISFSFNDSMWLEYQGLVTEPRADMTIDGRVDDTNLNIVRKIISDTSKANFNKLFGSTEIQEKAEKFMDRSTFYNKFKALLTNGEIIKAKKGLYVLNTELSTN